jgi:hypothetical protein
MIVQRSAARAKLAELRLQSDEREKERSIAQRQAALRERRQVYADLNAAARRFRSAAHDRVLGHRRNMPSTGTDGENLEEVRRVYRDEYARAQMVMPDRVLMVASEVNLCLGHGYRLLRDIETGSTPPPLSMICTSGSKGPCQTAFGCLDG